MNLQPTVVLDEAKFAKFVHEKADSTAGGANDFGESSLRNWGHNVLRLFLVAITRDQEERPGQAFLAGIEQLVDQILLDSDISFEHVGDKAIREFALFVQHTKHFQFFNSKSGNRPESNGSRDAQKLSSYAAFAEEISRAQNCDHSFFSRRGGHDNLDGAGLEIENGVPDISLEKNGLSGPKTQHLLSHT